ncbi:methyltransferase domain-containing protein [Gemmatimonas aurantiaca]|uniref:class I SAM-dependent methyltransferase n=1 Tax=Gemmatimonas aurantiaca TaxID=173480 RepID=UPI00301D6288
MPRFEISALDPAAQALATLHGDALDAALAKRFTLAEVGITVGAEPHARTFQLIKPANADHLISEADYVHDERLPYWADLWPSARVLAGALLTEQGHGRTLLELGCGLGLDTVAAMAAGFTVTSTDYYEDALHVARSNARRNLGQEPTVRMVNWRHWPEDLGTFDVVMAADVLYEQEYATLVADCLARALRPDGVALVADPGRLALPTFRDRLPTAGLRIDHITTTPFEEGAVKQQVQIMHIRKI